MLTDQEILDAVPHNQGFDERTKWLWFGRFIEQAVIDKLSKQADDQVYRLMVDLCAALYACAKAGKVNECDIIKQGDKTDTISDLLDRAESEIVKRDSFASKK